MPIDLLLLSVLKAIKTTDLISSINDKVVICDDLNCYREVSACDDIYMPFKRNIRHRSLMYRYHANATSHMPRPKFMMILVRNV